jgi:hypothetical protein
VAGADREDSVRSLSEAFRVGQQDRINRIFRIHGMSWFVVLEGLWVGVKELVPARCPRPLDEEVGGEGNHSVLGAFSSGGRERSNGYVEST